MALPLQRIWTQPGRTKAGAEITLRLTPQIAFLLLLSLFSLSLVHSPSLALARSFSLSCALHLVGACCFPCSYPRILFLLFLLSILFLLSLPPFSQSPEGCLSWLDLQTVALNTPRTPTHTNMPNEQTTPPPPHPTPHVQTHTQAGTNTHIHTHRHKHMHTCTHTHTHTHTHKHTQSFLCREQKKNTPDGFSWLLLCSLCEN